MKKLSKIKLQNAVVLEEQEMKKITGGGTLICGDGNGYTVPNSDYFETISDFIEFPDDLCGESGGSFVNHR